MLGKPKKIENLPLQKEPIDISYKNNNLYSIRKRDIQRKNFYFYYNLITWPIAIIFILPFKLCLLLVWILFFIFFKLCIFLFAQNLSKEEYQKYDRPRMNHDRSFIQFFIHRQALFMIRFAMFIFGVLWIRHFGQENIDKRCRAAAAAPHTTFLDWLDYGCWKLMGKGYMYFVAQSGTKNAVYDYSNCIYLYRDDPNSGENLKQTMRHRVGSEEWKKEFLMVTPEGTCGNGTVLLNFSQGLFALGEPIQPFIILHPSFIDKILGRTGPEWQKKRGSGWIGWTESDSVINIAFQLFLTLYQPQEFHVLPAYFPNNQEKNDPILYAKNFHRHMAIHSGLPITKQNRLDTIVLSNLERKYPKIISSSEKVIDQCFVVGGELLEKFGSENTGIHNLVQTKEIVEWSEEWVEKYGDALRKLGENKIIQGELKSSQESNQHEIPNKNFDENQFTSLHEFVHERITAKMGEINKMKLSQ